MVKGQHTDMFDFLRELEQRFLCGGVDGELEQLSHEFQQQCGVPCRLQLHLKLRKEDSGVTGICCPAL
jgi:hypothetical protein